MMTPGKGFLLATRDEILQQLPCLAIMVLNVRRFIYARGSRCARAWRTAAELEEGKGGGILYM